MTIRPEVDVDGIEDGKERESPRDAIDNYFFTLREELVYDSTKEKEVNERPLYKEMLEDAVKLSKSVWEICTR